MARKSNIPLSKLAVRMRDDMVLTGKSANTVKLYLAAVRAMARHYGMAPDRLTEEQVTSLARASHREKKWRAEHCDRSSAV